MSLPIAFISMGYPEMLLVAFFALLLFGKKLPEVARSLGKGVTEFKRGIQGFEDEIRDAENPSPYSELPHSAETTSPEAPKFEPPSGPPSEVVSTGEADQENLETTGTSKSS